MTSQNDHPDTHPLILFDGICVFCNRSVNFIVDHDPAGYFHFAPLQSPLAARMLAEHADAPADLSTVVLVENGKLYFRSTAALRISRHLSGPVSLLGWLILLPRPLRDPIYNYIARHRYAWFGKLDACRMPEPSLAQRFLFD